MSTIEGDDVARSTVPEAPAVCAACNELMAADARFCAFCGSARVTEQPGAAAPIAEAEVAPAEDVEAVELEPGDGSVKKPRRRVRYLLPIGVLLVVAVTAAAFLLRDTEPPYDLDATMTQLATQSEAVWEQADRASTLGQLVAAGEAAEQASTTLGALRPELVEVGNTDDRRAAEAAFAAQIAALDAVAVLATLEAEQVADWPDVAAAIQATVEPLTLAEADLVARDLPSSPRLAADVAATAERIEVSMASIEDKLESWAAEVERINADKFFQKAALDEYTKAFRAQMERYAGLRSSLGDLTYQLVNGSGMFSTAYADLGAALAQRREVHAAMSALVPPSGLVPAHTAIVSAVQDSTGAVQSAITGLEEFQWDWYYTLDSTPGWLAFQRASEQVGNAYNGGVGAWDAAVAAEEARIAGIKTPAQPAV